MAKTIIFFDLETTGKNTNTDRIVQIAMLKEIPMMKPKEFKYLVNPGVPIPAEATAVHGITDEMVASAIKFSELAPLLHDFMYDCDLAGYNIVSFDLPLLAEEFKRVGMEFPFPDHDMRYFDVMQLHHKLNPRTLVAAYKQYTGFELEGAHDAMNDVAATRDLLYAMQNEHDLSKDPDQLHAFITEGKSSVDFTGKLIRNADGVICYGFGNKNLNNPVLSDRSYALWMIGQGTFPADTVSCLKKILAGTLV